jgi:hypothetical protein
VVAMRSSFYGKIQVVAMHSSSFGKIRVVAMRSSFYSKIQVVVIRSSSSGEIEAEVTYSNFFCPSGHSFPDHTPFVDDICHLVINSNVGGDSCFWTTEYTSMN